MIKVLALDIAKNRTGWACGSADGSAPSWGVFDTLNWDDNEGRNLAAFRQVLRSNPFLTHIVMEEVFINVGKQAAFNYSGTEGQMMLKSVV